MRAAAAGCAAGLAAVAMASAIVAHWQEHTGEALHQSLAVETRNALVGGRYRVALRCANSDNRTSYFVRATSGEAAREALGWTLPVCDLVAVGAAPPPGRPASGWLATWYRGDFECPASFHRRAVSLSAPSLAAALEMVRLTVPRACRIEYADQTHCALARPGCDRASEDFREVGHLLARAPR
jgi:hypothetical protein